MDNLDYYVDAFKEVRERWMAGYFSWTETKDITEAELHTARDGFDAGAGWKEKEKLTPAALIKAIEALSEADRSTVLNHFTK